MRRLLPLLLVLVVGFALGRFTAPDNVGKVLNDYLAIGFRIYDEEGYEVEAFDEKGESHFTFLPRR